MQRQTQMNTGSYLGCYLGESMKLYEMTWDAFLSYLLLHLLSTAGWSYLHIVAHIEDT